MVLSCSKTATDSVCTWCFVVITLLYSIDMVQEVLVVLLIMLLVVVLSVRARRRVKCSCQRAQ